MPETDVFLWTDREQREYVLLRHHGSHWRVEWGFRDPPGDDKFRRRDERITSIQEEAVAEMLDRIRSATDDPTEPARAEVSLRDAMRARL